MIVDSSALLAIFFDEPECREFVGKINAAEVVGVGAPTLAEAAIVIAARLGEGGSGLLAALIDQAQLVVIPFDELHWHAAADAWLRFGHGRHEAGLNFGDCLAYATARVADRPLLFKGDDFSKTDIVRA